MKDIKLTNYDEKIAFQYLNKLQLGEIVYEPDGNVPPDFLVNRSIAVEVRRLNQNINESNGKFCGIEEIAVPLTKRVERILKAFNNCGIESWYVSFTFQRPLKPWKELEEDIKSGLISFLEGGPKEIKTLEVSKNFSLGIAKAGISYDDYFVLGGFLDLDSGGWVIEEMIKNINLCVEEKEKKIQIYREKYTYWWLLLVNHVSPGFNSKDLFSLKTMPYKSHRWDKIIIVNSTPPYQSFEL